MTFAVSDAAKEELSNRLQATGHRFVRLRMRESCLLSLRLSLEESVRPGDKEIPLDGYRFLLNEGELHYFKGKTLDFVPDRTGFRQFEIL